VRHKEETECPTCSSVYKVEDFVTCPGCGVHPDKDAIMGTLKEEK
jgi:Zn finger protein HypA/HybF involved in hydrogenase expression